MADAEKFGAPSEVDRMRTKSGLLTTTGVESGAVTVPGLLHPKEAKRRAEQASMAKALNLTLVRDILSTSSGVRRQATIP
jgi:hypothetical protein